MKKTCSCGEKKMEDGKKIIMLAKIRTKANTVNLQHAC